MSWILDADEAEDIRQRIIAWEITEDLSDDVSPTNADGSVYSFYGDFQTALNYRVSDFDESGNEITLPLIEVKNGKLNPKKTISKEEFLVLAYRFFKANACSEKRENSLALKINTFETSCREGQRNCPLSPLGKSVYDFGAEVWWVCSEWIRDPEWYLWRFYNENSWEEIIKYWSYIEDHAFLEEWVWKVFLRVTDNCGNNWEVYNTITVDPSPPAPLPEGEGSSWLQVSLRAKPIIWSWPLKVDFVWVANSWVPPYEYEWNFWDSSQWFWKVIDHVYKDVWVYEVILRVKDSEGNTWSASVLIKVLSLDSSQDSDDDGIEDRNDLCPLISWNIHNKWCPILEWTCWNNSTCSNWYECKNQELWVGVCLPKTLPQSCLYSGGSWVFWNIIVRSCPSNLFLDFRSGLRKCDQVFPAIVSPDGRNIYSRGKLFEIQ